MMKLEEDDEEVVRPVYETEALQITELCAFKVDHTAYNSYLYTGKMKVPIFSNIAKEDYASSVGASAGKNIRVHVKPVNKSRLAFNLDSQYDQDEELDNDENELEHDSGRNGRRRHTTTTTTTSTSRKATTSHVNTRNAANVCIVDDEPVGVRTRGARRNNNTKLAEWEFSLDDQDHIDFDSDDSDNLDEEEDEDEEEEEEDGSAMDDDEEDEDDDDDEEEQQSSSRRGRGRVTKAQPTTTKTTAKQRLREKNRRRNSTDLTRDLHIEIRCQTQIE
jgi:hypothetical protein